MNPEIVVRTVRSVHLACSAIVFLDMKMLVPSSLAI